MVCQHSQLLIIEADNLIKFFAVLIFKFYSHYIRRDWLEVVHISGDYVTFQNNTIINPHLKAVRIDAANGVKILNNTFDTGTSNPSGAGPDGMWLGNNGRNLEVAYNKILVRNSDINNSNHKDIIQTYGWQANATGGLTKIHHNFFYNAEPTATSNTGFELGGIGGNWEIYDNIFVYGGSGSGRVFYMGNCGEAPYDGYSFSAQIYNNTFYITNANYYGVMIDNSSSLSFKNNIVHNPGGIYNSLLLGDVTMAGVLDIDYNQYLKTSTDAFLYKWGCSGNALSYTWAQWRSTFGLDAHSEFFTNNTAIDFVGTSFPSLTPTDYALESSSSGINEGTTITLFSDDYRGVSRPQNSTWDRGAFEYTENIIDTTAPNLQGAVLNNSTILVLNFSESLNSATAQNKNNYSVTNGISVSSAVLSGTQVTLTTSAHVSGAYTVTVNNVTDLAGNIINPNFKTANYNYTLTDVTPPQVVSAAIIDSVTLNVYFSENLEPSSAQNISNYIIDGINVTNAILNANVVRLSTSIHTNGSYQVTVNHVTDLAGNLISQQNNYTYEYSNSSNGMLRLNIFQARASHWYLDYTPNKAADGVNAGESRWGGDIAMPDTIEFILDDIQILNTTKFTFYNWNQGRIYNYSILVSSDYITWNQIRTNIPSQPQEWSIEEVGPIEARYIKLIFLSNNQGGLYAGLWEAEFWGQLKLISDTKDDEIFPIEFSLDQNYPNPFNPSTKIKWQTPVSSHNTIKVYDVLGNEVAILVDEFKPSGSYEVKFDALSGASELASGVYVYRLQTTKFTETKKMVLLR